MREEVESRRYRRCRRGEAAAAAAAQVGEKVVARERESESASRRKRERESERERCTGPRCFSGRGEAPRDYSARIGQRGESSKHQRAPTSEKLLRIHPPRHGLATCVVNVILFDPLSLSARLHSVANDRATTTLLPLP